MLFNSIEFIFLFLPLVLWGFFALAVRSKKAAAAWLVLASIFFYGWWNPHFVWLLLASICFNYAAGWLISRAQAFRAKSYLTVAVLSNLFLLAAYKYANFFISTVNDLGLNIQTLDIVLPMGISFFTFTQIAFLVDVYRGKAREPDFVNYVLFVTWFPHLIAGPVLHHQQMMPQFKALQTYRPDAESIAVGLTLFSIGLFKKVILADHFADHADPVFGGLSGGRGPMLYEAWVGALAYTLQLYFDFSAYSDMALGISRIFNIKLPLNFNSPYKSVSIIEFWRRWHMTLSTFLRDYLYVPLGGNRKGTLRRHANLVTTMLLGGLWHGASWNFVLWGGLHGLFLVLNHGWRKLVGSAPWQQARWYVALCTLLTFTVVVFAWVPFRAPDLHSSVAMVSGMLGLNGVSLPGFLAGPLASWMGDSVVFLDRLHDVKAHEPLLWILGGLLIVWALPNSQELMADHSPACDRVERRSRLAWRPEPRFAILAGLVFALSVLSFRKNSPFLYFQF